MTAVQRPTPAVVNGVLYGMDAEVAAWVRMRFGSGPLPGLFTAFGVLRPNDSAAPDVNSLPNRLIAGVIYRDRYGDGSNEQPSDIMATVWVDDIIAAHPAVIRRLLDYPFGQLRIRRISARIEDSNTRAVNQAIELGFVEEGKHPFMGANGGMVRSYGLYRDNCRFWSYAT